MDKRKRKTREEIEKELNEESEQGWEELQKADEDDRKLKKELDETMEKAEEGVN